MELTFEDEDIPNVNENPLPNHGGSKVNAVEDSQDLQVKRDVKDVRMPMGLVREALVKAGHLKGRQKRKRRKWIKKNATIDITVKRRVILSKSVQNSSR